MRREDPYSFLDERIETLPTVEVPRPPEEDKNQKIQASALEERLLFLARLTPRRLLEIVKTRFERQMPGRR